MPNQGAHDNAGRGRPAAPAAPPSKPAPMMGERSLTRLDWGTITTDLATLVEPLLIAGADHLLPTASLRHLTVQALLAAGLQTHEITMDRRTTHGRAPIWLQLDTGVSATVDVVHLDHRARPTTTPAPW